MIPEYTLGILYGDGYYQKEKDLYFFSTTHKEIHLYIKKFLDEFEIKYNHYTRENKVYDNWELLEILEIRDESFLSNIKESGIMSPNVETRIINSPDFLRGYLETKGSFFKFTQRNGIFWRFSFSGMNEDLEYIKTLLNKKFIETHEVIHRKEREHLGVNSNSYRLSSQKRESILKLVNYLYSEENISFYLKDKMDDFIEYDKLNPFNQKKKIYKHYKNACLFMARDINCTIGGTREKLNSTGSGPKPIYLKNSEGKLMDTFNGWVGAYNGMIPLYESKGKTAPLVIDNK